jgi:hypothetical protein
MNFRQLVRTVDTKNFYLKKINPKELKAQYNPERFHIWKSLHRGPKSEVLNMLFSPHYRFLHHNYLAGNNKERAYYQLQRKFGRNDKWIRNKIKKFLDTYESIKKNGILENVSALEIPLVKNKHNKGFEIFEGHHRVSIALVLGLKEIECEIIRRKK